MTGIIRFYLHTEGPKMRKIDVTDDTDSEDDTPLAVSETVTLATHITPSPAESVTPTPAPASFVTPALAQELSMTPNPAPASCVTPALAQELSMTPNPAPPSFVTPALNSSMTNLHVIFDGIVITSRDPIEIYYCREMESSYREVTWRETARCRSHCQRSVDVDDFYETNESCDPLLNGYSVSKICKRNGELCFVERSDTTLDDGTVVTTYDFPLLSHANSPDDYLIVHHPSEMWGYDEGKLLLGIVSRHPNIDGVSYEWFRNGDCVYNAGCLFVVAQPGLYYCRVKAVFSVDGGEPKEFTSDSQSIQVVRVPGVVSGVAINTGLEDVVGPTEDKDHVTGSVTEKKHVTDAIDLCELSINVNQAIDHGSFGEVFMGTYKDAAVAIKRIKSKQGKRPEKLIVKEAAIHQTLSYPNIVKFIGTCMDQSYVYVVTELVAGHNMEDMVYSAKMDIDGAGKIKIALDVLNAVAFLHEHVPQIIHQDIKPANILISDVNMSAKLCDLGLAKVRAFDAASSTRGCVPVGTLEYMAPELIMHQEKASEKSDMWSVGVTLAEFFAGQGVWDLCEQEDEPVIFLRRKMLRQETPTRILKFPVLEPCVAYNPLHRPTASHLLKRFQCPACSVLICNSVAYT